MKRRNFLKTGAATSMVFSLPRFSCWAEASNYARTAPPVFEDYALNPARVWLQNYVPPTGYDPQADQSLVFTALGVRPPRGKQQGNVVEIGRLEMRRTHASDRVRYDIFQTLEYSKLSGHVVCRGEAFLTPLEWQFTAEPNGTPENAETAKLVYSGAATGNGLQLSAGPLTQSVALNSTATLLWNLLDAGEGLKGMQKVRQYDMFSDGLTPRPFQTLENDGFTVLPGSNTPVKTVMLHGPAAMPMHFLVTENKVPLGVTGFLLSWILTEVKS